MNEIFTADECKVQTSENGVHLHIISMHTSPLAQPGEGDAGGMNVYIDRSLRALLAEFPQLSVEIFTLAPQRLKRSCQQVSERAVVHMIEIEEAFGAKKSELPGFIDEFARRVQQKSRRSPDIIHSHYWLSGLVALQYGEDIPVVHTMHTTAAAKDARAGAGEPHEPAERRRAEQEIVEKCAALVVNTAVEKEQMVRFYAADPAKISIIEPGVDTGIFKPTTGEQAEHAGSATSAHLVFAGRPQPLKGPQILVEALALLPADLSVNLTVIGRSDTDFEEQLLARVQALGLEQQVELIPPVSSRDLAQHFRRADIVACPSSSETFGLVALEAQACGTPVIATDADGLAAAVENQRSGVLVASRTPADWAQAIEHLVRHPQLRQNLGVFAAQRAARKTWDLTAEHLFELYSSLSKPSFTDR